MFSIATLGACGLLSACLSSPDRFYTLKPLPEPVAAQAPTRVHVLLSVSIPILVDRSQMVITTSATGIAILDHQRWATPLSDQVSQTLARDIERRRSDLLIADVGFDQPGKPSASIKVEIVRMSAQRNAEAAVEAHWRIVDPRTKTDRLGSEVFKSRIAGNDYAAIAQAYSEALSALADKLVADLGPQ